MRRWVAQTAAIVVAVMIPLFASYHTPPRTSFCKSATKAPISARMRCVSSSVASRANSRAATDREVPRSLLLVLAVLAVSAVLTGGQVNHGRGLGRHRGGCWSSPVEITFKSALLTACSTSTSLRSESTNSSVATRRRASNTPTQFAATTLPPPLAELLAPRPLASPQPTMSPLSPIMPSPVAASAAAHVVSAAATAAVFSVVVVGSLAR
mmetsp:Transcript_22094/g.45410  ORF Transcript_22094/g.45410 Transcript_22094/m.45410 type:complete len:210 (+) Transcript_22094:73-702(+)